MSVVAVLLVCMLAVPALAFTLPNVSVNMDGNSEIGIFQIARLEKDQPSVFNFWQSFWRSNRNVVLYDSVDDAYFFGIVPDGESLVFSENGGRLRVEGAPLIPVFYYFLPANDGTYYLGGIASGMYLYVTGIVTGTYFASNAPHVSSSYIAKYEGDLIFIDDLGDSDDGGILGWLKDFWDNLLAFFKRLFIPHDGYFDDWFEDIRRAWYAKLGGLGTLFDQISNAFKGLSGNRGGLKIALPPNIFYSGFAGYEVDLVPYMQPFLSFIRPVLTAFFVIITAIFCYKRVVEIANT